MPKANETVLEINLAALKENYLYLKSKISSNTKFLAVVKAYAYGNNTDELATYLENLGVDYFAVAYTSEGISLRNAGIKKPILVLHPQIVSFNLLIEYNLEPNLYSRKILNEFIEQVELVKKKDYPIHLKFNTGLNRLGFSLNDTSYIAKTLKKTKAIKVKSIFSHLAASEDLNEQSFTQAQISSFKTITNDLINLIGYQPILHLCNTSGILNYPEAHFNMVRSGIGLYGYGNSVRENQNLKPIGTLKTIISQIHTLRKGESVGYNRGYISNSALKTATLPIGHADGIGRQYGNEKGYVIINNQKAPIIGNVCMDMIMVNVTEINCNEGDEVIIFGPNNTAENFAKTANTISYEILTSLSQRIKRVYLY
ncbi:alanine racemase [Tamlana sedimentorum]|uniref:Alanine racemase n=1 Tax=Neotamlana sedimentorum TaxID=1435349 RepID=A0A0D7WD15_9FLAO|nr:alanine racemase [Tamlana sedimentorum]KJD36593.1 alanine racemase [Tamlana sedimentorum]